MTTFVVIARMITIVVSNRERPMRMRDEVDIYDTPLPEDPVSDAENWLKAHDDADGSAWLDEGPEHVRLLLEYIEDLKGELHKAWDSYGKTAERLQTAQEKLGPDEIAF